MILITGATGLTGHFVVEELQRRKIPVRLLVRAGSLDKAPADTKPKNVEITVGDLTDLDSLRRACDGVSGIIHTACIYSDAAADIVAMQTLLNGWQTGPFIFISTLDVYGFAKNNPISESHPLDESYSDYARGKIVCERLLRQQAESLARVDYAILRAPYIWGPHPTARTRLIKPALREGQPIILPGADEAEWSGYQDVWIDVRDLAWIVAEMLSHPVAGPMNVLAGHFTWHDLYSQLIELTGSSSQIIHKPLAAISEDELPRKELYAQYWHFSDDRLRTTLGFVPRYTLRQTLEAVVRQDMITV